MSFSAEIAGQLNAHLVAWEGVFARPMFGCLGFFVGRKLFAIVLDASVAAKIPEEAKPQAQASAGARPFYHTYARDRRFGDWLEFPVADPEDTARLIPWLRRSYHTVQTPTAKPKSRRPKKASHRRELP
jgi:TfoX/Sxy family transcriptional regulator of competence genes